MMEIPIFVIGGFLDSGKSSFIIDAVTNDGFDKKGRTLIILCEEGEVEILDDFAEEHNAKIIRVSEEDEFSAEQLAEIARTFVPDRVIIEINCMWDINKLFFPEGFRIAQVLTFVDATTFDIYYNNMRQKFKELVEFSDLVVFNRCSDINSLQKYQTGLKLMNSNANFMIMDENGMTKKAFEEPLPYDITKEVIEIANDDYGRWYIDTFENPKRYDGKIVEFNALVTTSKKLPKGSFIAGRFAMTCCADDVQLYGHLCLNEINAKVKNKSWIHIKAKVTFEYSEEYQEEEAVLHAIEIKPILPLKNPILDLR